MSETVTCPTCKRDWPRHGMCCTCQLCGKHYDDCRCLADDLNDELEKMMRERDRLREYVGRLEAALVRLHEIYAWGVQQNDDDEHETWWKAALECVALGREIAGRKP